VTLLKRARPGRTDGDQRHAGPGSDPHITGWRRRNRTAGRWSLTWSAQERRPAFYQLRAAIEGLAAEFAVPRLTDEYRKLVEVLHLKLAAIEVAGDSDEFMRCKVAWHFRLYDPAQLPLLQEFVFLIWMSPGWKTLTLAEMQIARNSTLG